MLGGLKTSGKLDDALAGMAKLLDGGIVDPQLLGKALNKTDVFTGAYKQADLLIDAKVILEASPNIAGFDRLLRAIGKANNPGFLFELRGARKLASAGETVLEVATEGLSATDLRTATHLVQAKLTATRLERD
ncbi:MAG: hypothetical protein CML13_17190 [Puniceicoccaceae bacterium]|nr:hypothetical protein [Puniceicoccaceae bacterium]